MRPFAYCKLLTEETPKGKYVMPSWCNLVAQVCIDPPISYFVLNTYAIHVNKLNLKKNQNGFHVGLVHYSKKMHDGSSHSCSMTQRPKGTSGATWYGLTGGASKNPGVKISM